MIMLDTHTWIWFVTDSASLSKKARERIQEVIGQKKMIVSSISVWEACLLHKAGRLKFSIPFPLWLKKNENLPFLTFVPVNNDIAVQSVLLPGEFHKDPADRMIVSTAIITESVLITKDTKIRSYSHVQSFW